MQVMLTRKSLNGERNLILEQKKKKKSSSWGAHMPMTQKKQVHKGFEKIIKKFFFQVTQPKSSLLERVKNGLRKRIFSVYDEIKAGQRLERFLKTISVPFLSFFVCC